MKKRLLPIPLILLIPIVMLVVVVAAGIYRFSLSDEEIMAKFPSQQQKMDPILKSVFDLSTPNPWTVQVPGVSAFSFIDQYDTENHQARGHYDAGAERGFVLIDTQWLTQVSDSDYISTMAVSNQGSGVFYYASHFYYDKSLQRMILKESELLGDRIKLMSITLEQEEITFEYFVHANNEPMSAEPSELKRSRFILSGKGKLRLVE